MPVPYVASWLEMQLLHLIATNCASSTVVMLCRSSVSSDDEEDEEDLSRPLVPTPSHDHRPPAIWMRKVTHFILRARITKEN